MNAISIENFQNRLDELLNNENSEDLLVARNTKEADRLRQGMESNAKKLTSIEQIIKALE